MSFFFFALGTYSFALSSLTVNPDELTDENRLKTDPWIDRFLFFEIISLENKFAII